MKSVHILLDEDLLRKLDADPEVREHGRSEFLRRAARAYLRDRRKAEISDAYLKGYGQKRPGAPEGFGGWEDEAAWPEP